MSSEEQQMAKPMRREMGWPAAVTLIAAILGAAATTLTWAVVPANQALPLSPQNTATVRELGEVKARLTALEESSRQMRAELRSDIKEVRDIVRQLMKERRP